MKMYHFFSFFFNDALLLQVATCQVPKRVNEVFNSQNQGKFRE